MSESREIRAPIDLVWTLVSDVARYHEWVPAVSESVSVDTPMRVGARYVERSTFVGPVTTTEEWEVVEYDEPTWQRHRSTSIPIFKPLDVTVALEQVDPQTTRLTLGWHGTTALGPVGRIAVGAMRSRMTREIGQTADAMAAAAEQAAREG